MSTSLSLCPGSRPVRLVLLALVLGCPGLARPVIHKYMTTTASCLGWLPC